MLRTEQESGRWESKVVFGIHGDRVLWIQESNKLYSVMERNGLKRPYLLSKLSWLEPVIACHQKEAQLILNVNSLAPLAAHPAGGQGQLFFSRIFPVWTDAIENLPWLCFWFMDPNPTVTNWLLLANLCSRAFVSGPVFGSLPLALGVCHLPLPTVLC